MLNSELLFDPHILKSPLFFRGALPPAENMANQLKMNTNENPLGPSPQVVKVMAVEAQNLSAYPPLDGEHNLRTAIATMHTKDDMDKTNGRLLTPDHILVGNGGLDILDLVARGFLKSGDEMIISHPTFRFIDIAAQRLGATVINVPLDNEFNVDVEGILTAVTPQTRLINICNPNNPTGNIFPADAYDYLIQNLPKRILILSDEAYSHFADEQLLDTQKYIHDGRNLLQLHSFSKAFGLAGLRLGYGITQPEIADYLARLKRPFHLSRLTIAAGLAALDDKAHIQKTVETTVSGRGWLSNQLTELGVKVYPSQGNFLLMTAAGFAEDELADQLQQHNILVSPGQRRFNLPNHIRVTVGLPEHNRQFIEAMATILKQA